MKRLAAVIESGGLVWLVAILAAVCVAVSVPSVLWPGGGADGKPVDYGGGDRVS